MPIRVKICGICTPEDARAAVAAGADALGFVFAAGPRHVTPDQVADIVAGLPPFVQTVGVFVNSPATEVSAIARHCRLQALQFQGQETPAYCAGFDRPVIKGFKVGGAIDPAHLRSYEVAAYLLDSFVAGADGGTGTCFDWRLIRALDLPRPVIIAGGLAPHNVATAIAIARPSAVDVSSGVAGSTPRQKDRHKMAAFIAAAKMQPVHDQPSTDQQANDKNDSQGETNDHHAASIRFAEQAGRQSVA